MQLLAWFAVLALATTACKKHSADDATTEHAKSPLDQLVEAATLGVEFAASSYDELKAGQPDFAKVAAPRLAPTIAADWTALADRLRAHASEIGIRRARGQTDDSLFARVPAMLDDLAPHAPALARTWTPLKAELAALETTAFDTETNDKRPRVILWSAFSGHDTVNEAFAALVIDCVEGALERRWPELKFIRAYERPAGPGLQMIVTTSSDRYRSNHGEETRLASGAGIRLEPTDVPAAMAEVFSAPLVATGKATNPETIRSDLNVTPTLETMQAGQRAIKAIVGAVCSDVESQLGAR